LISAAGRRRDEWPKRARESVIEILKREAAQDDSTGVPLLSDIR